MPIDLPAHKTKSDLKLGVIFFYEMTGRNPFPFQALVSLHPLVCVIAGPGVPCSAQHLDRSILKMQQHGTLFPRTMLGPGSARRQNGTIMLWLYQYGKLQDTLQEEQLPPGSPGLLWGWPRASPHGPWCPTVHRHCSQAALS